MKTFKLMLILAGVALGAAACSDDAPAPAAEPPPKPKAAKPAAAAEDRPVAPVHAYSYNPVGKRDPFRSPQPEGQAQAVASGPCNELLCQFDLEQLKLVAVITGDASPVAMVEDPAGRGHVVRRNTRIGRRGGKVTAILRDSVTVTEYVPSGGKLIANAVSVHLRPDAEVTAPLDLGTGSAWAQ